jgi:hypothetical protein
MPNKLNPVLQQIAAAAPYVVLLLLIRLLLATSVAARFETQSTTAEDVASDWDLNYLCKNWSAAWPACTQPVARYLKDNKLLQTFPIGAWWDPTPDEWEVYKEAGFNWVQGVNLDKGSASPVTNATAAWAQYVALVERAAAMGLMVGGPKAAEIIWGGDEIANAGGSVLRLPGKCMAKVSRDTNGPVTQAVQVAAGCYLEPATDGHFVHSDTLGQIKWVVENIQALHKNISSNVVSLFLADDMSDWEEYNFEKAEWLSRHGGGILPYVNEVRAEGEPESLVRVPTPIFAPEVYGTRDLGKPPWARNKNNPSQAFLSDVHEAQLAQVQLYEIMAANAHRFDPGLTIGLAPTLWGWPVWG